jgi:ornithine cyclodeaminase
MKVKILKESEIRKVLNYRETIPAIEKSFADYSSGKAVVPNVINLDISPFQGEVHVKSAYIVGENFYVIKIASGFYLNPSAGLPVGNGMMLLYEAKTGLLHCLMFDNGFITEMRTGAAGAVAAKHLAKSRLNKIGIIGSGSQARFQLQALLEVRSAEEVWVWSRQEAHAEKYIQDMRSIFSAKFRMAKSKEEAVRESDLLITVTPSRAPLVRAEWVGRGTHITAVGSDGPEKRELEAGVLAKADKIFCDSISQCSRLGEVHHALEEKAISVEKISGELGQIVFGEKTGRTHENEITVADLTGLGVQDAAAALLVFTKAVEQNLGSTWEI